MESYQQRIHRIIRGLKRIPRDPFLPSISDELMDDYYHVYTDLYHLKDWLVNDSTFPLDKTVINKFIEQDKYLKRLQSLANGIKHLAVTSTHNDFPEAIPIFAKWKEGENHGEAVIIVFNTDEYGKAGDDTMLGSAFIVACINSWNKFLLEYTKLEPFKLEQMM